MTVRFCVVGTGRCGTTPLWRMLNLHPDIFVMRESHWIPKMYEFYGSSYGDASELVEIVLRTRHVTGELVFPGEPAALRDLFPEPEQIRVADFCDRIGSTLARSANKRYWADKTPDYGAYMGVLQSLWPNCRFIHLIRDGLPTALSMSRHPGYQWLASAREAWWVPASFNGYHRMVEITERPLRDFAALWCRRLRRIRDEAKRLRRNTYLELRFEDLLEAPAGVLSRVSRFVGLDSPSSWLDSASAVIDPGRVTSDPTPGLRASFDEPSRRLLAELGYPA